MAVVRLKLKDCGSYYVVVEGPREYLGMVATKYATQPLTEEEYLEKHPDRRIPSLLEHTRVLRTGRENSTE